MRALVCVPAYQGPATLIPWPGPCWGPHTTSGAERQPDGSGSWETLVALSLVRLDQLQPRPPAQGEGRHRAWWRAPGDSRMPGESACVFRLSGPSGLSLLAVVGRAPTAPPGGGGFCSFRARWALPSLPSCCRERFGISAPDVSHVALGHPPLWPRDMGGHVQACASSHDTCKVSCSWERARAPVDGANVAPSPVSQLFDPCSCTWDRVCDHACACVHT